MARSLNIETMVEEAFLDLLPTYVGAGVTVKGWDDIKFQDLTPMVFVKAQLVNEQAGTLNTYSASNILVDFGIFTTRTSDEDGRTGNSIRANVRELIAQTDIVSLLNATDGLFVYNNGVIPQASIDVEDKKMWQKTITILVVATTI